MNHTIVRWGESKFVPAHVIDQRLAKPESQSMTKHTVRVAFKGGAQVEVPHEEPFTATAMTFKIQLINAFVADGPMVETHITQSLVTKIELSTVDGKVEYTAKLSDVPFGFDTVLEPGKFYTDPKLNTNVHCDWVKDDIVHLTLVESYQHGNLIQARMRAKLDKAHGYVEITDKRTITRPQGMLEKLDQHDADNQQDSPTALQRSNQRRGSRLGVGRGGRRSETGGRLPGEERLLSRPMRGETKAPRRDRGSAMPRRSARPGTFAATLRELGATPGPDARKRFRPSGI